MSEREQPKPTVRTNEKGAKRREKLIAEFYEITSYDEAPKDYMERTASEALRDD